MRIVISILMLSWGTGSSCVLAQDCPATIVGSTTLKTKIAGWEVKSEHQKFYLHSLLINDGPISRNSSEPNVELKPMEKNGIQYWAFGSPIGKREMWMRCEYAQTSVTLSKRIHSNTALCFRRSDLDPKKIGRSEVTITCVDSSHKANQTLKPNQT